MQTPSEEEARVETVGEEDGVESARALLAAFRASVRELNGLMVELLGEPIGPVERLRLMLRLRAFVDASDRAVAAGVHSYECARVTEQENERLLGGMASACQAMVDAELPTMRAYARTLAHSC